MKRLGLLFLILILVFMVAACRSTEPVQDETELETTQEETLVRLATEEDTLAALLKNLQAEMRVFDVVEYHDAIYQELENAMKETPDSSLETTAESVVESFIENQLIERIRIELAAENPLYKSEEVDWLYDQIDTNDLIELIVLYEVLYYEKAHGKNGLKMTKRPQKTI